MSEFISELKAAWIGNRRRKFYQSTRGIMTPEERRALEEDFDRQLAERDRQVAEKALTDLACEIEATSKRTDNTFTEHAVVEAGGLELLREAAEAYRQERKE